MQIRQLRDLIEFSQGQPTVEIVKDLVLGYIIMVRLVGGPGNEPVWHSVTTSRGAERVFKTIDAAFAVVVRDLGISRMYVTLDSASQSRLKGES